MEKAMREAMGEARGDASWTSANEDFARRDQALADIASEDVA